LLAKQNKSSLDVDAHEVVDGVAIERLDSMQCGGLYRKDGGQINSAMNKRPSDYVTELGVALSQCLTGNAELMASLNQVIAAILRCFDEDKIAARLDLIRAFVVGAGGRFEDRRYDLRD